LTAPPGLLCHVFTKSDVTASMNGLIAVIPVAIVLSVVVSMGIAAALLGYPVWSIPLIALFGAGGAIVAI
jgi:hypothetical protein